MSSILTEIKAYLKTKSAITDLIGGSDARISKNRIKQNSTLPYIILRHFNGESSEKLSGGSTGLSNARIQIDCYNDTDETAHQLAEKVRTELQGLTSTTLSTVFCNGINSPDEYANGIDEIKDTDEARFWYSRDYIVHYTEN